MQARQLWIWSVALVVLVGATLFGFLAAPQWLVLPLAGIGAFVLLQHPILGLFGLALISPFGRYSVNTGTAVSLTPAVLVVPVLLGLWFVDQISRGGVRLVSSRTNRPLLLFVLAGLVSLAIGIGTWDPVVPRSSNFLTVQIAQWAIFAFSAGTFFLVANLIQDLASLRRLAFFFLAVAGALAILRVAPSTRAILDRSTTMDRAPFWLVLTALAGGQLIFNHELSTRWRLFLCGVVGACLIYAFYLQRATNSYWVAVASVIGVLAWLRWPRLRWPVIILLTILALSGALSSTVYDFAGGDREWTRSGGSRLVLIGRVIEVTVRNPITGLGPAAYRPYAGMEPLFYRGAYWIAPRISSHNNYVDIFSHTGLVGLVLFFWFTVEVARLGLHLRTRFRQGFAAGYVNGMLAAGAASLVLMLFADWLLPFVYNIGFVGFQSSMLVWLFMGGLVALNQVPAVEI